MTFDPTKPVQTRDGRPAYILATDRSGLAYGASIVAVVGQLVRTFQADGRVAKSVQSSDDLVNVPEETVEFRTIRSGEGPYGNPKLGTLRNATLAEARGLLRSYPWDGIAKITTVDGKLTGLEFIP